MPSCTTCNEPGAKHCTCCRSTAYCSIECQQADWSVHRLLCRSFAKLRPRPSPSHKRAILFPMGDIDTKPRLVWVDTLPKKLCGTHDKPVLQGHLNLSPHETEIIGLQFMMVYGNKLRCRPRNDHAIELTGRDVFQELPVNQSIASVYGSRWTSWYGPWIAMAKAGAEFDPPHYQDITLDDLRDVADYLSWYREGFGSVSHGVGNETPFDREVIAERTGKTKAVRVNCRADRDVCRRPWFEAVDVPRSHPLFEEEADDPSDLGDFCAKAYAPDPSWKSDESRPDRFDNPVYDALFTDLRPGRATWGRRPEWRKNVKGSVLLASLSREDLSVDAVRHLYFFARDQLIPRMLACGDDETEQRRVLRECCDDR